MRRVWIEIQNILNNFVPECRSPSMRREWIEIHDVALIVLHFLVTLHVEGVD